MGLGMNPPLPHRTVPDDALDRATCSLILAALMEHPGQMPLSLGASLEIHGQALVRFTRSWFTLSRAGYIVFQGPTESESRWHATDAGRAWFGEHGSTLALALMKGAVT